MVLYHEIDSSSLQSVLQNGLKCTHRGSKGSDKSIVQTDEYLDKHRPDTLKEAGISRGNNLYAFIGTEDTIINIKDGAIIPVQEYLCHHNSVILKLQIDAESCYVSDLDKYDALKSALSNTDERHSVRLAREYWDAVVPLQSFHPGNIARPEAMIIRDVRPGELTVR